jgi:uroporphyrin-III C-methyltransferase/precorrin-2 dehydrogenase/sirohydrochlorin ferrochelatase
VVSDGASPAQRTLRTTLARLARTLADEGVRPPAVWVVGDVVGLGA